MAPCHQTPAGGAKTGETMACRGDGFPGGSMEGSLEEVGRFDPPLESGLWTVAGGDLLPHPDGLESTYDLELDKRECGWRSLPQFRHQVQCLWELESFFKCDMEVQAESRIRKTALCQVKQTRFDWTCSRKMMKEATALQRAAILAWLQGSLVHSEQATTVT